MSEVKKGELGIDPASLVTVLYPTEKIEAAVVAESTAKRELVELDLRVKAGCLEDFRLLREYREACTARDERVVAALEAIAKAMSELVSPTPLALTPPYLHERGGT